MTLSAWIVVGCVIGALALFASERVRPEGVGVAVLLTLALTGVVDAQTAFAGFASPAVITVGAMFILSAGLVEAGVPAAIATAIARYGGTRISVLTALLVLVVGTMSAFMNNIAATVILLPVAISLARTAGSTSSRLLIPLSFGSLLGGLMTQIGTPPNLLVSEALVAAGHRPFGMFDYAPTGAAVLGVGLLYLLTVGRRLLPDRPGPDVEQEVAQTREYLSEIVIPRDAAIAGEKLADLRWRERYEVSVIEIIRDGRRLRFPSASDLVFVGDILLAEGERDHVIQLVESEQLDFAAEANAHEVLEEDDQEDVLELIAGPGFSERGRSVADMRFRNRFGGLVLGVWRQGVRLRGTLRRLRIETGDVLLVRMPGDRISDLDQSPDFIVLSQRSRGVRARPRMLVAIAVLTLTVLLAATGVAHIAVAAVFGATVMIVTRVLPYHRVYAGVDWRTLVLIATLLPLGTAMQTTGLAEMVSESIADWLRPFGPLFVLAGLFVLTALLTQIVSNAAAVVLIAPIALGISSNVGIAPHPALMMVAIAGSAAFLTPVGHQANVLVYNTGSYRFLDFLRVGGPLTLLILIVSLIVVPVVWPL